MSIARYLLLVAFLSFNALLFAMLMTRAIVGVFRARSTALPKIKPVSNRSAAAARNQAWTRAVRREKLVKETERRDTTTTAHAVATTPYSKVLC